MHKKYKIDDLGGSLFEHYVKGPLKTMIGLVKEYPEPTKKNCTKQNALAWLGIRNWYLRREKNPYIRKIAKLFFDLLICEYQHDSPYEERIDVVVIEIVKAYLLGKFKLRERKPSQLWEDSDEAIKLGKKKQLAERIAEAIGKGDLVRLGIFEQQLRELIGGGEDDL